MSRSLPSIGSKASSLLGSHLERATGVAAIYPRGMTLRFVAAATLFIGASLAGAITTTWTGSLSSNWSESGNWSPSLPQPGDDVVIANAGAVVLLTNSVGYFGSLQLGSAGGVSTLVFSNWDTCLSASNITIATNGTMTCVGPYTNNTMSNRVYLVCSNLMINAGGKIYVDSKGYMGGGPNTADGQYKAGYGPGYSADGSAYGGKSRTALPIGSATNAEFAGSGGKAGYYNTSQGGPGGGAVRIEATGRVDIFGAITANGGAPSGAMSHSSSGTGGGIYISCLVINGTNSLVEAKGGSGDTSGTLGQVGTGGRIAVHYSPAAQSAELSPRIVFDCSRGTILKDTAKIAEPGTVYFTDGRFVETSINSNRLAGQLVLGVTNLSVDCLAISNCWVGFQQNNFQLTVSNDMLVMGTNGRFEIGGAVYISRTNSIGVYYQWGETYVNRYSSTSCPTLCVGGNMAITNGARFVVYAGMSSTNLTNYGALVNITGDLAIYSNSAIYVQACPTNSGYPLLRMRDLFVETNASINADYAGYAGGFYSVASGNTRANGYGPAGGSFVPWTAGTHGGAGGRTSSTNTYGSSNAPVDGGSGGGAVGAGGDATAGSGGGVVRIESDGRVTLNGAITANGYPGYSAAGAGAGGSAYIRCHIFSGVNGVVQVKGGANSNNGAGGGGGRIAIWRQFDAYAGVSVSVAGGVSDGNPSYSGQSGTVVWGQLPPPITVFRVY